MGEETIKKNVTKLFYIKYIVCQVVNFHVLNYKKRYKYRGGRLRTCKGSRVLLWRQSSIRDSGEGGR